jgi:repressor LexA
MYRKQRQVFDFLSQYIKKHGYAPILQEIADGVGVHSLATVHEHLGEMVKLGLIRKFKGGTRGIEILERGIAEKIAGIELPLMGFIAAGQPLEPCTDTTASFAVPPSMVSAKKRSYLLQVKGSSMIDEGIVDGDLVVIEEQEEAKNGEIVVALLENGFATLKRFYKEATRVRLEPANAQMQPIFAKNVRIQGKVVGLIRRYTLD